MIERVILHRSDKGESQPESNTDFKSMPPLRMLLYAAARSALDTLSGLMLREQFSPKSLEINLTATLSAPQTQSESEFRSFHVIYHAECATEEDASRIGAWILLTQRSACGMMAMLRKIAPVNHEISIEVTGR